MKQHPYARAADQLLRSLIESMGYQLWGCRFDTQDRPTLQVFIDGPDGIELGDCERVSQAIQGLLDVADTMPGAYQLEVSSPGIDRFLFNRAQLERYQGHVIDVKLAIKWSGRWRWQGLLQGWSEAGDLLLQTNEQAIAIPLGHVKTARLSPSWQHQNGITQ